MNLVKGGRVISGIGEFLKNERLEKGFTLEDVQDSTKIRKKYIEAIENEDFNVIKGKIYVKGFIKSYARFLKISNIDDLMDDFEKNFPEEEKKEINTEEKIEILKSPRKKRKNFFIFAILAVLSLLTLNTIYSNFFQEDVAEKNGIKESKVIPIPPTSNNPEEESSTNNNNASIAEVIPQKLILTINILDLSNGREACWVQVYADGKQVFEGTLFENDIEIFEGEETIRAVFGNAGVVNLSLGEKDLGAPGKINEVVEKNFNINDI